MTSQTLRISSPMNFPAMERRVGDWDDDSDVGAAFTAAWAVADSTTARTSSGGSTPARMGWQ